MAVLTDSGRSAIAVAVKAQPIHLAWGTGDTAWDTTPVPEGVTATQLVAEIGRRRATQTLFCLPDPNGEIEVPNGRFTISQTPTKYLYMRFTFDFADAADKVIRETAVFLSTAAASSVPTTQAYLTPAQVADPGQMLALERVPRIERNSQVRQQFEFVIQF